jgi:hypothetical protein
MQGEDKLSNGRALSGVQGLELCKDLWNEMVSVVVTSDAYTNEKIGTLQIYLRTLQLAGWDGSNLEVNRNAPRWFLDFLDDNGVLRLEHLDIVQSNIEWRISTGNGNPHENGNDLVAILQLRRRMMSEHETKLYEQVENAAEKKDQEAAEVSKGEHRLKSLKEVAGLLTADKPDLPEWDEREAAERKQLGGV